MADKAEITVLKLRSEKYTELLGDDFFSGEGCNAWREKNHNSEKRRPLRFTRCTSARMQKCGNCGKKEMDPRLKRLKNREVPKKETGKETMHLER